MNSAASWNWSCPYCEARDPECHRSDCAGFTPENIRLRQLLGGQYFGKRQFEPVPDGEVKP